MLMRRCPILSAATCSHPMPLASQSTRSGLQLCALHLTATLHLAGLVIALLAWTTGVAPLAGLSVHATRAACRASLWCVAIN